MVPAVYNPVCTEIIVGGAFPEIAAVGLEFFPIAVFFRNGLVRIVPDEAALVEGFGIGQVGIFVHGAAGISHGVGVFAADKRLVPVLGEELLNTGNRGVHLALHVAGIIVAAVMENAFIVH